jgi:hypothetical protein
LAKAQSSFFGGFLGSIDHLMLIKCISVGSIFLFNFVGKNLQSFTKKPSHSFASAFGCIMCFLETFFADLPSIAP